VGIGIGTGRRIGMGDVQRTNRKEELSRRESNCWIGEGASMLRLEGEVVKLGYGNEV